MQQQEVFLQISLIKRIKENEEKCRHTAAVYTMATEKICLQASHTTGDRTSLGSGYCGDSSKKIIPLHHKESDTGEFVEKNK